MEEAACISEEDKLEQYDMGVRVEKKGKKITDSIWETLVLQERLAPRVGPSRLLSKYLALWSDEKSAISTKDVKDAFLTFPHLPMIPSVDSLQETITQGVSEGLFGYARGSLEKSEFHSVRIGSGRNRIHRGNVSLAPEIRLRAIRYRQAGGRD
jgi:hypothetical protein